MRVLVIDDNPLDIELISRMLQRRLEATVESVHTAEEGLRRLQVEEFDAVLLDYCLPGQNGIEFLREVQELNLLTPVLVVTSRGDARIMEGAMEAGAVDYISKDESLTPALPRAVEAAVARGRAHRASLERARAEELWHNAEKRISELETRVTRIQTGPRELGSELQRLPTDSRRTAVKHLVERYIQILQLWVGTTQEAQRAREILGDLVMELRGLGFSAEQLVSLHTDSLHRLRELKAELMPQNGCTPRMLLLEASLALLDAYRRGALTEVN